MRLKHIHIAGFKSFVDPVTIPATAQLTGIVGPNGCGKSNVIDAVRWVLGESKARELRGASLQDVIFNGSAGRKPAGRASVELLFDNSAGRAAGQWSHYAEIAVKRVLTRSGDSSYHINNVQVRKKDMADLFLGTGLGGDAYAIIEQGMISRIIEARPEELRGFLEEAAGVSKYKERRRETEARLRDTRENLERVADIRAELGRQLDKLGVQAEVARRYFALDEERLLKTQYLALSRWREARLRQADLARQLESARTDIEARLAELRHHEAALEDRRLAQFEATEALNQAQARYYQASGEVARAEQELRHVRATRERLQQALRDNAARAEAAAAEADAARAEGGEVQAALQEAQARADMLAERAALAGESLPEADAAWREAQAAVAAAQREISQHEQRAQLEAANRSHAEKAIERLKARELRLLGEQKALAEGDAEEVEHLRGELEQAQERAGRLLEYLETARAAWPEHEARLRQARQAQDAAQRELHRLEAETAALGKLQAGAQRSEREGTAWLARHGLVDAPRLWQTIRVESGWETAVEAALGESMAALAVETQAEWLALPPEARFELVLAGLPTEADGGMAGGTTDSGQAEGGRAQATPLLAPTPASAADLHALADLVHTDDRLVARLLQDRLALAWATDTLDHALARRGALPPGGFIATREGHRVSREGIVFNAPEKGHHGLIARAREIERLQAELDVARAAVADVAAEVTAAEDAQREARRQGESLQSQHAQAHSVIGAVQARLARAQEAARRVDERRVAIAAELDEVYQQLALEEDAWNEAGEREREARLEHEFARERLDEARLARQETDRRLSGVREAHRQAEREAQEAAFQVRTMHARLEELAQRVQRAARMRDELAAAAATLQAELGEAREEDVLAALAHALTQREESETALAGARDALEAVNAALRDLDAARQRAEHGLEPLKQRATAIELKLQEAQLNEARYAEELDGVDVDALDGRARDAGIEGRAESWLKAELARLEAAIAELGPVNMAALQELEAAGERKRFLDDQAADLETAAATLEEAIRRIDAETRARLRDTYDRVSREFRDLFTELFGGGEAQLSLTGEEILDAGLSVLAQPPGKKNSSIQLLSGGEKALTALALVFAFFRLNPAPFCLLDEVDAPLDDSNTERYCALVRKMSAHTQFLFITHNRITMEMAQHLVGVTMPEPGVSRPVAVDVDDALRLTA